MVKNKKSEVEKLKAEIERLKKELKKRKKYGLVWEDKPEDVVEMCKKKLPVLKEVKNKEIITDKNKPVNLLIEGDNYYVLSVLNYTHAGKVDVIYIDPPYNTGNKDFIFNDQYVDREDAYRHSKWLSFMERRLRLAKNLLKDDGVIFISIDDNEVAQLKLLCDEIFTGRFIAIFPRSVGTVPKTTESIQIRHDYILCYSKKTSFSIDIEIAEEHFKFDDNDGRGKYALIHPLDSGTIRYSKSLDYPIRFKGKIYYPGQHIKNKPDGKWLWRWNKDLVDWAIKNNLIVEKNNRLYTKNYREFRIEKVNGRYKLVKKEVGKPFTSDTFMSESFGNRVATREFKNILPNTTFTHPKPSNLIKKIIRMATNNKSAIILDFFAGSGTTAHAVLALNKEDGGNRQFILCTNNENNICTDVCYPRIKKVIEGYKNLRGKWVEELGGNLKYFKTDFVDYDKPTDKNKIKLTKHATEMLCVKEGTFEKVMDNERFKIFKNSDHYTGIIWDQTAIPEFKKVIKNIKAKFSVYIFSLTDETFDEEFADIKQKVKLSPIPEAILRVYRRIFR
jgi:adenine-specific DNA-methyltransferase